MAFSRNTSETPPLPPFPPLAEKNENEQVANGDKCDGDKIHGPRLNPGPTPILSPDMTADRTPVIAKTTGRPKPDGGGKHQREKEEKEGVGEEEASPQQEEQHRKRQESIASSEGTV